MIHLATGIALREGRLLLVASHYPNHPEPLWNLPGGRQRSGELLVETVAREFLEETGLRVYAQELAYVSESYDRERHFLNVSFLVKAGDDAIVLPDRDHVVAAEWVALADVRERIAVAVVRDPLIAYLQGVLEARYAGFHEAGVTIEWPADSV